MEDVKKLRLDHFLTQLEGEEYTAHPQKEEILNGFYNSPVKLEQYLYKADPDLYVREQTQPGKVKEILAEYTNASAMDIASSWNDSMWAGVANSALGVASLVSDSVKDSQLRKDMKTFAQESMPAIHPDDTFRKIAYAAPVSAGQMGVAAVGGAATVMALGLSPLAIPSFAAGYMSLQSGGSAAGEHLDEGGTRAGALAKGVAYGAAEFGANRLLKPMEALMSINKAGVVPAVANMVSREVPEELLTEVSNIVTDYVSGTGSKQPALERLKDVALTTPFAAALGGAGVSVINPSVQNYAQSYAEKSLAKEVAFKAAEAESLLKRHTDFVNKAKENGDAVEITEEENLVPDPETTIQVAPKEVIDFAAANTYEENPVDVGTTRVRDAEGNVTRDAQNDPVYKPGDRVLLKVFGTTIKDSEVLGTNPGSIETDYAEIIGESEDPKFIKVRTQDGQEVEIFKNQIVSGAKAGRKTVDLKVGEKAPSYASNLRLAASFFGEIQAFFKGAANTKKAAAFAITTFDPATNKPIKLSLDKALKADPDFGSIIIAHEIGHILSFMANQIPGSGEGRLKANSLLRTLTKEYTSAKSAILKMPIEMAQDGKFSNIMAQQKAFHDGLQAQAKAAKRNLDGADHKALSKNWDYLLGKNGFELLSKEDKADIRKTAYQTVREEARELGLAQKKGEKDFYYPTKGNKEKYSKYRDRRVREEIRNLTVAAYDSKGMYYLPALREELQAVAAVMRGLDPTKPTNLMSVNLGQNSNEEMYADFFSAKFMNVKMNLGDKWVNVVDALAPTLSAQFDNYAQREGTFNKLRAQVVAADESSQLRYERLGKAMEELTAKHVQDLMDQSPDSAVFKHIGASTSDIFIQGMVNSYRIPYNLIYKTLGKEAAWNFREKVEVLQGISSKTGRFMSQFKEAFDPYLQEALAKDPDANPETLLGLFWATTRIATGGRTKHFTSKIRNSENKIVEIKRTYQVHEHPDAPTSMAEAREDLETLPAFVKHKEALTKMTNAFEGIWKEMVLNSLVDSQVISQEEHDFLDKEMGFYATFAVYQDLSTRGVFKRIAPALHAQSGTSSYIMNPVSFTQDKGLDLMWLSAINDAKRDLGNKLPEDMKTPAKMVNGAFQVPTDKRLALLAYKEKGLDVGYYVPVEMTAGVEYADAGSLRDVLAFLSSKNDFFRRLFTTHNPAFTPKNMQKDLVRLWKNAYNPDPDVLDTATVSIFRNWSKVLYEQGKILAGRGIRKAGEILESHGILEGGIDTDIGLEAEERFRAELDYMFKESQVMSDYDWYARDARSATLTNVNMLKHGLMSGMTATEQVENMGKMGKLIASKIKGNLFGSLLDLGGSVLDILANTARGGDLVSKRAAFRHYKPFFDAGLMSQAEFNHNVRTAGSPNFLNKGAWHPLASSFAIFYNPMAQALDEDLEYMKRSKAVMAKSIIAPAISAATMSAIPIALLRALGGGDDELRKKNPQLYAVQYAMNGIPARFLESGVCIPLAFTPEMETVFFYIPHDETTATFKRFLLRGFDVADEGSPADLVAAVSSTAWQHIKPSLNPMIGVTMDFISASADVNPRSTWDVRRGIIREKVWGSNSPEKYKALMRHFYNSLCPTSTIYRMDVNEKVTLSKDPETRLQQVAAWLKTAKGLPFAQTALKMANLRISGAGHAERQEVMSRNVTRYRNSLSLLMENAIETTEGTLEQQDQAVEAIRALQPAPNDPVLQSVYYDALDRMPKMYKDALRSAGMTPDIAHIMRLPKAEREEVVRKRNNM